MEIVPTSIPELPKPSRTLGKNNYTGGHETRNRSFWITCLCYHKSAVLCYSPNCVINWFVSPNGPCNQGARVTTRPLLPNGLCHQTACVINRLVSPSGLCHQTVCVTKRPVSPNGLCSRGCFGKRPATRRLKAFARSAKEKF